MQFLDNRVRILYPIFVVYMGEILLQFWKFKKSYFSFLQSYGCINIPCHIFNSAQSNQEQLVIFIVKKQSLLLQIPKSDKYFILAYFKVSITTFHTSPKSFREAQYDFVDRVLLQLVPYQLQNFLELIDVLWLGLKWLVAFKHRPSSPDMVVQRVEVRRVRRPFIFTSEFTAVGSNPVLSQLCRVSCWKMMKPDGKTDLQSWTSFGNRVST